MGIEPPRKGSTSELVDEMCEILMECYLTYYQDQQHKLALLKIAHDEQK